MIEFSSETAAAVYDPISLEEICNILTDPANQKVLILAHVNPDGDAIGSAFGLKALLVAMGKVVRCAMPTEPPKRLHFLMDQEDCAEPIDGTAYDLVLTVDTASPGQLGHLDRFIPEIDLMIDHHGTGTPYASHYVDATASATGEIIFALYRELQKRGNLPSLPDAARSLYAAIVSDTGCFKFSNTTPLTHRIAAELVEEINGAGDGGDDTTELCRALFGQRTLKELHAQMHAIQNLQFYCNGALGVVLFTRQRMAEADLTDEDIGNVVETPRGVEGVLIGLALKQSADDPRTFKVSSRANGDCNVAAVCAEFGGGGHVRAAGCTITADSPEEALAQAAAAFSKAIDAYRADKM